MVERPANVAGHPFMSRVVAISNQKGGVGKTTTAVNLAASMAVAEQRVLLVDLDARAPGTTPRCCSAKPRYRT